MPTPDLRDPYDRLDDLAALKPGWDSYGAHAISPSAIEHARKLLRGFAVVPCCDGSLQLELHALGLDLEIYIDEDGIRGALFWRPQEPKGEGK
jgi:hypothetical protein